MPEGIGKGMGVLPDFTLGYRAPFICVDVLDRVLDGDDTPVLHLIEVIYHGGERGGLAAAGRPANDHQAARPHDKLLAYLGNPQGLGFWDGHRQQPHYQAHSTALPAGVKTDPANSGKAEPEVELLVLLELCQPFRRYYLAQPFFTIRYGQRRQVAGKHKTAVNAEGRRPPHYHVQVRGAPG